MFAQCDRLIALVNEIEKMYAIATTERVKAEDPK